MEDTVKLSFTEEYLTDFMIKNLKKLIEIKLVMQDKEGWIIVIGSYKGLKIKIKEGIGVWIEGSLPKFFLKTNQATLTRFQAEKAFRQLEIELGLPIMQAKVNRLDIAENIITKEPASMYFDMLREARYFSRLEQKNGVYYQNSNRTMCFYEKLVELRKNGEAVCPLWLGKNILRYELRFLKHQALANYLKVDFVTVETLIVRYPDLVMCWVNSFNAIRKELHIKYQTAGIKLDKSFMNQIKIMGINSLGGLDAVFKMIESAKKLQTLKYQNQSSNLKAQLRKIMQSPSTFIKSMNIEELENKIKWIGCLSLADTVD